MGRIAGRAAGGISIHVLRVEDDLMPRPAGRGTIISIHVLRVEDDPALRR